LFVFLIFISIISFNCQKEVSYSHLAQGSNSSFISATLQGNIIDENGFAAQGVTIRVGNQTVISDSHGYFRIKNALFDANSSFVIAEKDGYFTAYRSFIATSGVNNVVIKLTRKNLAGIVNSSTGGAVNFSNGAVIFLPANGIVNASDGSSYKGEVSIYASYIDPTASDIGQTIPGSFMADDKNNKRVVLASFGMLAVELLTSSGEKLQIASGSMATLTVPIPTSKQTSAPSSISLWYLDEKSGIWKEEGTAKKDGNNYVGQVRHFSFWNCDLSDPAVTLSMTLHTPGNDPLVYTEVRLTKEDGMQCVGWTDSMGEISGLVPANENLTLDVLSYPCLNTIYSEKIGPFNSDADLGTIKIANTTAVVTVKGKLLNCNNAPVTNGYAMIFFDNTVRYAAINNTGDFSVSLTVCPSSPGSLQVIGIDNEAGRQSFPTDVNITSPVTNIGMISTCGISSDQYINYTLDGKDHSINSSANDSLIAYSYPTLSNPPMQTGIMGMHGTADYIDFRYDHNGSAGQFPLSKLFVQSYDSLVTLVQPFNITITDYPQNVGEYYQGSFSGKFTTYATGATLHSIDCSFRVRRLQ
ncbi:MAG TPA: hypothetical protein VGI82_06855, partial [Chitinophagaceae bacterium]